MNLFGIMDVSASALKAERVRAEVVASNMANAETTRTADGGPYRRQHVVFSAGSDSASSFGSAMQSQMSSNFSASSFNGGGSLLSSNASAGVQVAGVVQDAGEPLQRYDPGHPDANADGYVAFPDINPLTEMVDLMGATRAYGMNASAVQAEKGMLAASLDLLK
jgi:flagellar basal-body rod protein FlgC